MRRRIASLLSVAALVAACAVLTPAPGASASTGVCAGTGVATTGAPLTYPITMNPTPSVPVQQPPVGTSFFFGIQVGGCVNVPGTTKGVTATGNLLGWCGHVSGSGVTGDGFTFSFVSVGNVLVLTGGLVGVVNAVFDAVNGEDCNTGADNFLITGAAVKQHCNVLNVQRLDPGALGMHYWAQVCLGAVL